jgi:DNA-binding MarR family transcriptional regulator
MVDQTPCINNTLDGMMNAIIFFRNSTNYEEKKLSAQFISVFLCVASRPGISQEEIVALTLVPESTVSHILNKLGFKHRVDSKDPLKWVKREQSPEDHKRKLCYLTPKGQIAADHITNLLQNNEEGSRLPID